MLISPDQFDAPRPRSLEGLHRTVPVPHPSAGFLKQLRAFAGPAVLVSVGYMDPGNWGTDLQAGASYRYALLWIVVAASVMAMLLQVLSAQFGIATGRDLAQACREWYPKWTRVPNWLAAEIAIGACDLAEVLGSAVALNLLFHIPLTWAVVITGADVLILLGLQRLGMRWIEAVVGVLIGTIVVCYIIELFVLPRVTPGLGEIGSALLHPGLGEAGMATVAVGIIGATVMPHNLYLHSALVQSRAIGTAAGAQQRAMQLNTVDTVAALSIAMLVNAAILVLAAIVFNGRNGLVVHGVHYSFDENTDWIRVAFLTLAPLLGAGAASILFAVALLASGQSSTIAGTLAGQVVMEGFLHWRVSPWLRRLVTRMLAILPAVLVIGLRGGQSVNELLVLSQVVLAMQLPFAMFPLLNFCSRKRFMGAARCGVPLLVAGWCSAILITAMDLYSLPGAFGDAWRVIAG